MLLFSDFAGWVIMPASYNDIAIERYRIVSGVDTNISLGFLKTYRVIFDTGSEVIATDRGEINAEK